MGFIVVKTDGTNTILSFSTTSEFNFVASGAGTLQTTKADVETWCTNNGYTLKKDGAADGDNLFVWSNE